MRRDVEYRWRSRPLSCKLSVHSSWSMKELPGRVWVRQCSKCPYYWYV